ncbi:MAG TPA: hypothetical protein VGH44_03305 [Candidatus Saccharimonadia bacterium]|jgi:predicted lipid-binding transport protein (Tim44 family)
MTRNTLIGMLAVPLVLGVIGSGVAMASRHTQPPKPQATIDQPEPGDTPDTSSSPAQPDQAGQPDAETND